jgi:hypothetical protein
VTKPSSASDLKPSLEGASRLYAAGTNVSQHLAKPNRDTNGREQISAPLGFGLHHYSSHPLARPRQRLIHER